MTLMLHSTCYYFIVDIYWSTEKMELTDHSMSIKYNRYRSNIIYLHYKDIFCSRNLKNLAISPKIAE